MTDVARKLPALLRAAEVLADRLDAAGDRGRPIGARLRACVVGPLQSVAQPVAGGDAAEADPVPLEYSIAWLTWPSSAARAR
jgi:hypothetical protein